MSLNLLVETCKQRGIDRVVVTDHNTITGAQAAHFLDPERVIVGEEIMTTKGEILAAFVTEGVLPMLSPEETIKRLREQGAFISVSHPFDAWRREGWEEPDLMEIVPWIDAIEVYNSRCMLPSFNSRALDFAHRHNLAETVGLDAHIALELGRSVLLLELFNNPGDLRKVIRDGVSQTRWTPPWFHFSSRYASYRKKNTSSSQNS